MGRARFPFSSLPNPLNGSFDLTACGTLRKHFRVSIGYKTQTLPGDRRTEVWITPRFLVEQNLDGSADYFRWIFNAFTSPVGLYWGIANDKCKHYNTNSNWYCEPNYGQGAVYNLQSPLEVLCQINLLATVRDEVRSPYDLLKPEGSRDMIRSLNHPLNGGRNAVLHIQFPK